MFTHKQGWIGYFVILCLGTMLLFFVHQKSEEDYQQALDHYRTVRNDEAQLSAEMLTGSIEKIYQNLRTISFLPSVRKIDRHATNLDDDDRKTIQQIYNNLANSVSVSEVYIVPASLNPEAIDPVTNEPEAPILMFDEMIVDAGKKKDAFLTDLAGKGESAAPSETTPPSEKEPEHEEVEIHEYQLLKEKMQWLRERYPTIETVNGLDLPMIAGRDVITCDNSTFNTTLTDADRTGIILSVPFFGEDGVLKGTISAIILNNAIRAMLPKTNYALVNPSYNLGAVPDNTKKCYRWTVCGRAG